MLGWSFWVYMIWEFGIAVRDVRTGGALKYSLASRGTYRHQVLHVKQSGEMQVHPVPCIAPLFAWVDPRVSTHALSGAARRASAVSALCDFAKQKSLR